MSWREIRPISIGLLKHEDSILVGDVSDFSDDKYGYRPLGGGIEYGESSKEALIREFREELSIELSNPSLLTVVENRFTVDGELGHEIVFVYDAEPIPEDSDIYEKETLTVQENEVEFRAEWRPISDFESKEVHIYPPDVLTLVTQIE